METFSEKLSAAQSAVTDMHYLNFDGDDLNKEQFVSFSIGEQQYCVDIMQVREFRAWDGASPMPNTPDYVRGVINLRGQIVPVVDLGAHFGHGLTDTEKAAVIVVVMIGDKLYGLMVDAVSDILSVNADDIAEVPDMTTDSGPKGGLLTGIITLEDSMTAIIGLDRLLVT